MEENPYAAPKVYGEAVADKTVSPEFYVVALGKFYALYLVTLGIYGIYWYYRNWKLYKQRNRAEIWPIARAVFPIFFTHSLCEAVDEVNRRRSPALEWRSGTWATLVVVTMLVLGFLNGLARNNIGSPVTDIAALVLLVFQGFFTAQIQRAINSVCGDPKGNTNQRFSAANILWLILGGVFVLLALVGALLPNPA